MTEAKLIRTAWEGTVGEWKRSRAGSGLAAEYLVEHLLGFLLLRVGGEGQLGDEDLPGLRQHPLLAGGETLFLLPAGEVPYDLGDLVDVAGAELLDVGLEAAAPVGGHAALLGAEHLEHFVELVSGDDVPDADLFGVVGRDHQCQVAVGETKNEILLALAVD